MGTTCSVPRCDVLAPGEAEHDDARPPPPSFVKLAALEAKVEALSAALQQQEANHRSTLAKLGATADADRAHQQRVASSAAASAAASQQQPISAGGGGGGGGGGGENDAPPTHRASPPQQFGGPGRSASDSSTASSAISAVDSPDRELGGAVEWSDPIRSHSSVMTSVADPDDCSCTGQEQLTTPARRPLRPLDQNRTTAVIQHELAFRGPPSAARSQTVRGMAAAINATTHHSPKQLQLNLDGEHGSKTFWPAAIQCRAVAATQVAIGQAAVIGQEAAVDRTRMVEAATRLSAEIENEIEVIGKRDDAGWGAITVDPMVLSPSRLEECGVRAGVFSIEQRAEPGLDEAMVQAGMVRRTIQAGTGETELDEFLAGIESRGPQEPATDRPGSTWAAVTLQAWVRGWRLRRDRCSMVIGQLQPPAKLPKPDWLGVGSLGGSCCPLSFVKLSARLSTLGSDGLRYVGNSAAGPAAALADRFQPGPGSVFFFTAVLPGEEASGAGLSAVTVGLSGTGGFSVSTPPGRVEGTVGLELRSGRLWTGSSEPAEHRLRPCAPGDAVGCGYVAFDGAGANNGRHGQGRPMAFWTVNDRLVAIAEVETPDPSSLRAAVALWPETTVPVAKGATSALAAAPGGLREMGYRCGRPWEATVRTHMAAHHEAAT